MPRPGIYARAFLEGRLTEDQLDHFRREGEPGVGLSSYPHPRLMPDFWEYPTVSMGLGPISAVYQARFNRYLQNRGILDTSNSRVWAFLGDGETDEPESLGALHLAAREGLDNLTFVVNCNLQRLDGPVRGNGKIIQELEAVFRGAGWNVIKVIWAREWDELLARDVDGVLVQQMNDTLDGEFQKFSVAGGAYIREHFFGPDQRLRKLVEHLTDDDLAKLRRGGHDYRKVYAAYKAATEFKGAPTVILAKTVKGWTLGPGVEARNITHQAKKLSENELKIFRDRLRAADPGLEQLKDAPYYHPGPKSEEVEYLSERRRALGGPIPKRVVRAEPLPAPAPEVDQEFAAGSKTAVSTTMVFARILRNLIRDKELGQRIVPIIPDEARTFGMDPLFKEVGIYAALGQRYEPGRFRPRAVVPRVDRRPGPRGGHHRGRLDGQLPGGRHVVRDPWPADDPVLHLLLDVRLPADRRPDVGVRGCPRARLPDGRHGRSHDARRRRPPARRRPQPHPGVDDPGVRGYDPAFAYELAAIVRDGIERMYVKGEDVYYYITLYNENYAQPPKPRASTRGSCAASTASPRRPVWTRAPSRLASSGRAPSSTRSSPRATCWPRSSGSPPRSTAPRRSRSCAATRWRPSAGTGSIPTPRRRACRSSARSCRATAGRSWPPPTG